MAIRLVDAEKSFLASCFHILTLAFPFWYVDRKLFDLAIEKQRLRPAVLQNAAEKSSVDLRLDVLYCMATYSAYSRRVSFGFLKWALTGCL